MLSASGSLTVDMKLLIFGSVLSMAMAMARAMVPDMTPLESTFERESWKELRKAGGIPENPMHPKLVPFLQNRRYLAFIQAVDATQYSSTILEPKLIGTFLDLSEQQVPLPISYPSSTQQLIAEIKDIPEGDEAERVLKRQVIRAFVQFHNKVHKNLNQLALHLLHPSSTDDSSSPTMQLWVEEMIRVIDTSRMPDWIKWLSIHPMRGFDYKQEYALTMAQSRSGRTMRHRTGKLEPSIIVKYTVDFKNELIRRFLHEHLHAALLEYVTSPFTRDKNARKKHDLAGFDAGQPDGEQTYFLLPNDEHPHLLFEAVMTLLGDPNLTVVNKIEMLRIHSKLFCSRLNASHANNLVNFVLTLSLMPNQQDAWKLRNAYMTICNSPNWNDVVTRSFNFSPVSKPIDIQTNWRQSPSRQLLDVFVTSERDHQSRQRLQSRRDLHIPLASPRLEFSWMLDSDEAEAILSGYEYLLSHGPAPHHRRLFEIFATSKHNLQSRRILKSRHALRVPLAGPKLDLAWLVDQGTPRITFGGFEQLISHGPVPRDRKPIDIQPMRHSLDSRQLTKRALDGMFRVTHPDLSCLSGLAGRTMTKENHHVPLLNFLNNRTHFNFEDIQLAKHIPRIEKAILEGSSPKSYAEIFDAAEGLFDQPRPECTELIKVVFPKMQKKYTSASKDSAVDVVDLVLFFEKKGYTKTPAFFDLLAYILQEDATDQANFRNAVFAQLCIGNVPKEITDPMTTRCRELPQFLVNRYREQMLVAMENLRRKPNDATWTKEIADLNTKYSAIWVRVDGLARMKYRLSYKNSWNEKQQLTAYGDSSIMQRAFSLDYVKAVESLNLDSMTPFRHSLISWASHDIIKKHNRLLVESEILYGLTVNNAILDMKYFFGKNPHLTLHYTNGFKYFLARAVHTLAAANNWALPSNIILTKWHPSAIESFPDCEPATAIIPLTKPTVNMLKKPPTSRQVAAEQILAENERRDQFSMAAPTNPTIESPLSCVVSLLTLYFDQARFPFYHTIIDPEFEWPKVVEPAVAPAMTGHLSGFLHEWLLEVHDNIMATYQKKSNKMVNPAMAILVFKVYIQVLIKYMDFSASEAKPLLQYIISSLTIAYKAAGLTTVTKVTAAKADDEGADGPMDAAAAMMAHFAKLRGAKG